jgi:putative peptidoglycan lipid II flippase
LVATLYHYGKFTEHDVQQTTLALMGYGVGLIGLVAIKVLAPGFYASQNIRTPVMIAVAVLILTQMFNFVMVPWLQHAGLALSIGLGALVNATWLLIGLLRRGSFKPSPGWGVFLLQVIAGSALLAVFLIWAGSAVAWTEVRGAKRIALLAGVLAASGAIYFIATWAAGLKLQKLLKHSSD